MGGYKKREDDLFLASVLLSNYTVSYSSSSPCGTDPATLLEATLKYYPGENGWKIFDKTHTAHCIWLD